MNPNPKASRMARLLCKTISLLVQIYKIIPKVKFTNLEGIVDFINQTYLNDKKQENRPTAEETKTRFRPTDNYINYYFGDFISTLKLKKRLFFK